MDLFRFTITEELEGERIDKCVSMLMDSLSRSYIQKLIKDGALEVNGQVVKGSYKVSCDDEICFELPPSVEPEILAQEIPLDILYEDKDVIYYKVKANPVHHIANTTCNYKSKYHMGKIKLFLHRHLYQEENHHCHENYAHKEEKYLLVLEHTKG